jgi:hypothetical protein
VVVLNHLRRPGMVADAGEVVENLVYSDGIPGEYHRENGFWQSDRAV